MQRRIFLRGMGAAILALPLLAADTIVGQAEEQVAEKPYLINTRPLEEGLVPDGYVLSNDPQFKPTPVYLGTEYLVPEVKVHPANLPTMYDPLGQWGFISWKIKVPVTDSYGYKKSFGDWVKISDYLDVDDGMATVLLHALPFMREQMEEKMKLVAPNAAILHVPVVVPGTGIVVQF